MSPKHLYSALALVFITHLASAETATIRGAAGAESADGTVTIIIDSDRDGLTDAQEDANGNGIIDAGETDPRNPDSDGDGLTDGEEQLAGTNPLMNQFLANPDSYGLPASVNTGLRIRYDFESIAGGPVPLPRNFQDLSGFGNNGTFQFGISLVPGITGQAVDFGGTMAVKLPPSFAQQIVNGTYSASLFVNFSDIGAGVYYGLLGGSYYTNGFPNLTDFYLQRVLDDVFLVKRVSAPEAFSCSQSLPNNRKNVENLKFWNLGKHDDLKNKFHHLVFGSSNAPWLDGVALGAPTTSTFAGPCNKPSSSTSPDQASLGDGVALNSASFPGPIDRFRFYNTTLSEATVQALADADTDGDGISDRVEFALGSSTTKYEGDVDRDGLTNLEERNGQAIFNGVTKNFGITEQTYFDSDGDLFDDYWEAKYFFSNVNPNDATKPINDDPQTENIIEGDYDSDELSNYLELVYGTDPNNADTDEDGVSDLIESEYGSSPTDGSKLPLNPQAFYGDETLGSFFPIGFVGHPVTAGSDDSPVVTAQVGDPSGSHSERWRLRIGEKQVVAQTYGALSPPTKLALDPTEFHEIRLEHVATDPNYLDGDDDIPGNADDRDPDYDYWAAVRPRSGAPFLLCDPEELLRDPDGDPTLEQSVDGNPKTGFLSDVDPVEVGKKTAYLVPLDNFSWATSYSGGDAVGPRHRKIALNGRPMSDEKPQQEEESDLPDEETYIDAFNLSLQHNTTFGYMPLGSSDLVLQATASSQETGFSSRSGLRPDERFDLPFGVGWSSNLCSYVEVIETIGDESDDPVTVNVVDETGQSQRFGTKNFEAFFPWPSSRVDKKSYLNVLTRNGPTFTLQKKFGNALTYSKCKTWFMYATDRQDGSTKMRRHTYWRLTEARDRYGVRLQYKYDSALGVPNDVTLIPREISSPDRARQFLVIERSADSRRVKSITDGEGNLTKFNYDTITPLDYELAPGNVGDSLAVPQLTSVTYADGTSTGYSYSGGLELDRNDTDPDRIVDTFHYHTNLRSVTDKRGNSHLFTYTFDQSKEYWDSSVNGTFPAIDLRLLPEEVATCVEQALAERNEPGKGDWKTMYGMGRKVTSVTLPNEIGTASFGSQGQTRFRDEVTFPQPPRTTVVDAEGKITIYEFNSMFAELVDVDLTPESISKEWMVYYLTSRIRHGGAVGSPGYIGTESYSFDPTSGLSLIQSTDMSGNVTTWTYDNPLLVQPFGLKNTPTMTKWADPTSKTDPANALGQKRTEQYEYGDYRVMSSINDPYGTLTNFNVDRLGRRKSKEVFEGGNAPIEKEVYDYQNLRFKAFQTKTTTLAFANFTGQPWETDLKTVSFPDDLGRLWRTTVDPDGVKLSTENTYDLNNNKTSTLDARGNRTRFKYDKLNRLTEVTFPSAGTKAGEAIATKQIWYDRNGNKAAEIDEEGHYTIHHYDALNRRVKTIRDMDGLGLPQLSEIVADGGFIVEQNARGQETPGDLVTAMEYNSVGSLIKLTDPMGTVTLTFFDSIQRPEHVFGGLTSAEATDVLALVTTESDEAAINAGAQLAVNSTAKTHTEFSYNLGENSGSTAFDSSGFKPTQIIRHGAVLTATGTINLLHYRDVRFTIPPAHKRCGIRSRSVRDQLLHLWSCCRRKRGKGKHRD